MTSRQSPLESLLRQSIREVKHMRSKAGKAGYAAARKGIDQQGAWDEFLDLAAFRPSMRAELAFREGWRQGRLEYEAQEFTCDRTV